MEKVKKLTLSVDEAARTLGVSQSWLEKLRHAGKGPPFLKLGRRVLYDAQALAEWAHRHRAN